MQRVFLLPMFLIVALLACMRRTVQVYNIGIGQIVDVPEHARAAYLAQPGYREVKAADRPNGEEVPDVPVPLGAPIPALHADDDGKPLPVPLEVNVSSERGPWTNAVKSQDPQTVVPGIDDEAAEPEPLASGAHALEITPPALTETTPTEPVA